MNLTNPPNSMANHTIAAMLVKNITRGVSIAGRQQTEDVVLSRLESEVANGSLSQTDFNEITGYMNAIFHNQGLLGVVN